MPPNLAPAPVVNLDSLRLLSAKRALPRGPRWLIARPRITALLDDNVMQRSVTTVTGPAGAGKSSVVAAWARQHTGPIAWQTLTPTDDTRSAFWRQIALTLSETDAGPALTRLALPTPRAVDELVGQLTRALDELDQPVVLVLDDLHEIHDPAVMADLDVLLRSPPDGLRLVMIARHPLPLRLTRLRLTDALGEITEQDLRFSNAEAAELLRALDLSLTDEQADRVAELAEGWGAGLALCAMALKDQEDVAAAVDRLGGHTGSVSDYLLEESFAHLDPAAREFLMSTSVLRAINGSLADAVTDRPGGAAMLDRLQRTGVLIEALDDQREWYRYHGLLAGTLQQRLRRERPKDEPVLHQRAAQWLSDHGLPVRAARHAVAAHDSDLAGRIAARHAVGLQLAGRKGEFADVLWDLPRADLHGNADLAFTLAGAAAEAGDAAEAREWDRIATEAAQGADPATRAHLDARRANIEVYLARASGDLPQALRALALFEGPDGRSDGAWDRYALTLVNVGALEAWLGRADDAIDHLDRGLQIARDRDREHLQATALAFRGVANTWRGEIVAAGDDATAALALADARGWRRSPLGATALIVLSTQALLRARLRDADVLLDEVADATTDGETTLRLLTAVTRGRIARVRGDPRSALALLRAARSEYGETPFYCPFTEYVLGEEALALHALGETEQAVALLETSMDVRSGQSASVTLARLVLDTDPERSLSLVEPTADDGVDAGTASVELQALLVTARAQERLGRRERSAEALEAALALVDRTGVVLPVLDQGQPLIPLLRARQRSDSPHVALAAELARTLEQQDAGEEVEVEELSPRELGVLRFLPTSMSNREIAGELSVSVNTVKTHLKSVYAKLGARDRRDAVIRARHAGLLSR
jgi:LuxR family maltose regulon positive regulatory protein